MHRLAALAADPTLPDTAHHMIAEILGRGERLLVRPSVRRADETHAMALIALASSTDTITALPITPPPRRANSLSTALAGEPDVIPQRQPAAGGYAEETEDDRLDAFDMAELQIPRDNPYSRYP